MLAVESDHQEETNDASTSRENWCVCRYARWCGRSIADIELEWTGSLLFCPDCGTLLNLPQDGQSEVTCEQCGHDEPASCTPNSFSSSYTYLTVDPLAYENIEIITRSHPDAFPSALRQKGKTQTKTHDSEDALLKVLYSPTPDIVCVCA